MAKPYEIRIKVTAEGKADVKIIERDLKAMKRSAAGVDKKMAAANKQTRALGRNMKKAGGHARTMGASIKKAMGYLGIAAGGYILIGQLKDASRIAMKLESDLANVNSLLGKSHPMYGQYRDDLLALKRAYPVLELEDMSAALYEGISAGHDAGQIMEYLNATGAAAAGGWTDMATVVKGTNKVMAAYGIETKDAIRATDIGLKTVEKANLSYAEYADKIGMVVGSAATAEVSIEELHAAIAASSKILKAEQVFTGLRGAMLDLPKKKKELKALGVEFTTFADTIAQIKRAKFGPEDWQALGMEREGAEALKAIILQYDTFTDTLRELGDVGGTTMEKLADRTETAEWAMASLSTKVDEVKVNIGKELNEALIVAVGGMDELRKSSEEPIDTTAIEALGAAIKDIAVIANAAGKAVNWISEKIGGKRPGRAKGMTQSESYMLEQYKAAKRVGEGAAWKTKYPKSAKEIREREREFAQANVVTTGPGGASVRMTRGMGGDTPGGWGGKVIHFERGSVNINAAKLDDKSFLRMVGKMVDEEAPA